MSIVLHSRIMSISQLPWRPGRERKNPRQRLPSWTPCPLQWFGETRCAPFVGKAPLASNGRIPSAGTRTVRLAGRAKQITFHIFDPRVLEDLLDRGRVDQWREEDVAAAAENRRRAAYKAKLTRSLRTGSTSESPSGTGPDEASGKLAGWEEFGRDGFCVDLRRRKPSANFVAFGLK